MSTQNDTNIKKQGDLTVNKLEKYLKHRSITQRGFAKKIGTTPNNLSSLIRGKSIPSLRLGYEIEKKTGGLVTLYDWIPEEWKKNEMENEEN